MRKLLLATTAIVVLWVSPAMAGPLVAGITGLLGTTIGATGATIGGILGGVALNFGASYLMSLFTPDAKQRGIKQETENGAGNAPHFIVGRYATPGTFVYQGVLNEGDIPNQCYVQVIALSMLPIKGIESQIFIQGKRCNVNLNSNWPGGFKEVTEYVQGGGGGGYCLMKFYDGTQNSVDSWLLNKFKNHPDYPIHENAWWRGCALVIIQNWYSNKGVWTGWPEFRFVAEGIDLYDPRKDSSVGGSGSQRWGQPSTWDKAPANAKVIEYNAIRGISYKGKWQWGGNAEAYRLPLAEWFAAMNACDEGLPLKAGGTVPRGHIGAEIHFDDDPREIINEINKHVSGYTSLIGGFYKTWCGSPGLSVMTITDEDFSITEEREDELFRSPRETYNTAYAYYPDARGKWDMKDSPRYIDHDALEAAGEEHALDAQLPFFTHPVPVQRALKALVKDSQRDVTHRGFLPPEAYVLEPFDRVMLISADNGYSGSGKAFRTDVIEDLNDVRQDVLFREINSNDDGWFAEYELEDAVGTYAPIIPATPVLDITATADSVNTTTGKDRPAIRAEWTWGGADIDVRDISWRIRRTGTTKVIGRGVIESPEDGEALISHSVLRFGTDFDIQFWPAPFANKKIARTAWKTVTMLPVEVPAQPDLTVISVMGADKKLDYFVLVDWPNVTQRNEGYKVRVTTGGRTRTYISPDNQHTIPVSAPSEVTVAIATKAADGGTASAFGTARTVPVNKRAANSAIVTGLTSRRVPKGFRLNWDPSTHEYHDKFGIWGSTTNNFANAVFLDYTTATTYLDDRARARKQKIWHWAFDYDKAGNRGERAAPVEEEYTLIESDDIDETVKQDITAEIQASVQAVTDQVALDIGAMNLVYENFQIAIAAELAEVNQEFDDFINASGPSGVTIAGILGDVRALKAQVRAAAAQAAFQGAIAYTQKEELKVEVGENRAYFLDQIQVLVTADLALATRTTLLETATGGNTAAIENLSTAMTTADEALTVAILTLNTGLGTKANASAVDALTTRVTNAENVNTSQATALTDLNTAVAGKAAASAVSALDTRVTAAEGSITANTTAITNLGTTVDGKASATALDTLSGTLTDIGGNVTAIANALSELHAASTPGNVATARVRMAAQATPAGWAARYGIEIKGGEGSAYRAAGFYMDAGSSGQSRVVIEAGKFVVTDGTANVVPFTVSGGSVYMQNAYIYAAYIYGQLTASQISVGSLSALSGTLGSVNISSAIVGSMQVGTLNIAGNAVTVSAAAEGPGGLSVAANAETTIASVYLSWGSIAPQNFEIGYQFRSTETMNYKLRIYFNGMNVTSRSAGYIPMRSTVDDIMSAADLISAGSGYSGGTFTITLQRDESGVPATPVRGCYIKVTAQKR